jgi:hypothetical protein
MKRIVVVPFLVGLSLAIMFAFPEFPGPGCQAGEKADKGTSPASREKTRENIEWLVFSATEHQRGRHLVMKQEHITPKDIGRFGLIYIALADLRDDGVQVIFVYEDAPGFCGTLGCPFDIYQVRADGLVSLMDEGSLPFFLISIDFDKRGHQKVFGVLQSKTMGWHDIVLQDEGLSRWRWKKDHYEGAGRLH